MATRNKKPAAVHKDFDLVESISLNEFARKALYRYGTTTNLERQVPCLEDGLKVVHRRALYSMSSYPAGALIKTAAVAGDTIGKYHPHADTSVSDAIATLVNLPVSLVFGEGNWGGLLDEAAAPRYTNCRLNRLGRFLLDKDYMHPSVTPMVPNYSNNLLEPVVMPMRVPYLMLAASSAIGYGINTFVPTFEHTGLFKCVKRLLENKAYLKPEGEDGISNADYARMLRLSFTWGGEPDFDTKELRAAYMQFLHSPEAPVRVRSTLDIDQSSRRVTISGFPVHLDSVENIISRIRALNLTAKCEMKVGTNDAFVAVAKRCNADDFDEWVQAIRKATTGNNHYRCIVTTREATVEDGITKYKVENLQATPVMLLKMWVIYRVALEQAHLKHKIGLVDKDIAYLDLLLRCSTPEAIDIIASALKMSEAKNPLGFLCKRLELTEDEAKTILGLRISQLSRVDVAATEEKIANMRKTRKQLVAWTKNPEEKIALDMDEALECITKDLAERKASKTQTLEI